MPTRIDPILLIEIGVILFVLLIIYIVVSKFTKASKLSKRLENYTIEPILEHGTSVGSHPVDYRAVPGS